MGSMQTEPLRESAALPSSEDVIVIYSHRLPIHDRKRVCYTSVPFLRHPRLLRLPRRRPNDSLLRWNCRPRLQRWKSKSQCNVGPCTYDPLVGLPVPGGLLFVAYCLLLALCMRKFKWSFGFGVYLFVATLIPFGTFVTDRKLKEKSSD